MGAAVPAAAPVAAAVPVVADAVSVGPKPVAATLVRQGYRIGIRVVPNRATTPNRIVLTLSRDGVPVAGAHVALAVAMTTMDMGTARYTLRGADAYAVHAPAWVMAGEWQLEFAVTPPGGGTVRFALDDLLR